MKNSFYLFITILCFSCNNTIEKTSVQNLKTPCECVHVKLSIYQEIDMFYEKYSDVENFEEVDMGDFSKLMRLWQKNDEIDFKIRLNHWEGATKSCSNYYIIDSLRSKMNI